MNWKALVLTFLLSTLLVITSAPAWGTASGQSQIIEIGGNGNVRIKPRLSLFYFRVQERTPLPPRSWVRVAPGASAKVLCSDWTYWSPPAGRDSRISDSCSAVRGNPLTGITRGDGQRQDRPYLISPRNTAVLLDQPLQLTWNPVPGATAYEVTIKELSRTIWTTNVTESAVTVTNTDILRPGNIYDITISATVAGADRPRLVLEPGSTEPTPTVSVLSDKTLQALRTEQAQIEALGLTGESHALALIYLYKGYGLYQMALDGLAEQLASGIQNATLYQLQGDLYQQINLKRFAQNSYQQALEMAQQASDLPQQAYLQEQIGRVALNLEAYAQALDYLSAADATYRQFLGQTDPEAQAKLTDLQDAMRRAQERS